jgi:hypothetical protein
MGYQRKIGRFQRDPTGTADAWGNDDQTRAKHPSHEPSSTHDQSFVAINHAQHWGQNRDETDGGEPEHRKRVAAICQGEEPRHLRVSLRSFVLAVLEALRLLPRRGIRATTHFVLAPSQGRRPGPAMHPRANRLGRALYADVYDQFDLHGRTRRLPNHARYELGSRPACSGGRGLPLLLRCRRSRCRRLGDDMARLLFKHERA